MADRGITRLSENNKSHRQAINKMPDVDSMTYEERREKRYMHHKEILWIYWFVIILGVWMILSPLTFGYGKSVVLPGGDRSLWLSTEARITAMRWSDIISGFLLIFWGWQSLLPERSVSKWMIGVTGIWITTAPLLFWAPSAAAYLNGMVVGALAIALSVIIPGIPNLVMFVHKGPVVPPGWSYNPSSWPQRSILILLAFAGWMVSRYLGAYQMGFIDQIWEPFFGEGSKKVLFSDISHSLPVSDGALGAYAYTFEFLMVWIGAPTRWRTMPWIVTLFGILVIPLGLVHIFLVISQPVLIGQWCTLCLLAAAIMLPMIPLEADEVIANIQHLKEAVNKGENFWYVFFTGGGPTEVNVDERSPQIADLPIKPAEVVKSAVWGMSVPWTLGLSTLLGFVMMLVPGIFGVPIDEIPANICHLGGALVMVTSVISMGEVLRRARYFNIILALIILMGPWFFGDAVTGLLISTTLAGLALILLALPRGPVREKYGFWDKYIS